MEIGLRQVDPRCDEHLAFIMDAWVSSYVTHKRLGVNSFPRVCQQQRDVIRWLLDHKSTLLIEDAQTKQYVGFVCFEPSVGVVHFVYVKYDWRCAGVATKVLDLLVPGERTFTHQTGAMRHLEQRWSACVDEHRLMREYHAQGQHGGRPVSDSLPTRGQPEVSRKLRRGVSTGAQGAGNGEAPAEAETSR